MELKSQKLFTIGVQVIPIILMIGLIPVLPDDYVLALVYIAIIISSFLFKIEKGEILIFFSGLAIMTIAEVLFVNTGVETFTRRSLFGLMPIWLPILWGYGFVIIKRIVKVLEL